MKACCRSPEISCSIATVHASGSSCQSFRSRGRGRRQEQEVRPPRLEPHRLEFRRRALLPELAGREVRPAPLGPCKHPQMIGNGTVEHELFRGRWLRLRIGFWLAPSREQGKRPLPHVAPRYRSRNGLPWPVMRLKPVRSCRVQATSSISCLTSVHQQPPEGSRRALLYAVPQIRGRSMIETFHALEVSGWLEAGVARQARSPRQPASAAIALRVLRR